MHSTINRWVIGVIGCVSAGAFLFLIWLIYFKTKSTAPLGLLNGLPAVNSILNACSTGALILGFKAIRAGDRARHKAYMVGAFVCSTVFLMSYTLYHSVHADTVFLGHGWIRPVYFFVLISHILLTIVALPFILTTFFFALTHQFSWHKKIARVTFPIWLYVSVTGVAIYFLLRYGAGI